MTITNPMPQMSKLDIDRFWSHVDRGETSRCWNWLFHGSVERPRFHVSGVSFIASRLSYYLATGNDPKAQLVCHTCDNSCCCNPTHLFLGTTQENSLDCRDKGRLRRDNPAKGEKQHLAVLNSEAVKKIRMLASLEIPTKEIARKYNVALSTVLRVVARKTWKHI